MCRILSIKDKITPFSDLPQRHRAHGVSFPFCSIGRRRSGKTVLPFGHYSCIHLASNTANLRCLEPVLPPKAVKRFSFAAVSRQMKKIYTLCALCVSVVNRIQAVRQIVSYVGSLYNNVRAIIVRNRTENWQDFILCYFNLLWVLFRASASSLSDVPGRSRSRRRKPISRSGKRLHTCRLYFLTAGG